MTQSNTAQQKVKKMHILLSRQVSAFHISLIVTPPTDELRGKTHWGCKPISIRMKKNRMEDV